MVGIGRMAREIGETAVHDILCLVIAQIQKSLNVTNTMSAYQIKEAADLIRREYNFLTPFDFKVFSDGAKMGKFGTSYNRLDVQVLLEWLKKYVDERFAAAEYHTGNEVRKLSEGQKMSPEEEKAFRERFYSEGEKIFQAWEKNAKDNMMSEEEYLIWRETKFNTGEYKEELSLETRIEAKKKELAELEAAQKARTTPTE